MSYSKNGVTIFKLEGLSSNKRKGEIEIIGKKPENTPYINVCLDNGEVFFLKDRDIKRLYSSIKKHFNY